MKREALRVTSTIPVAPTTLYFAWIDSEHHSSMTGDPAKLEPVVGAKYSAVGGYVTGKLVILDLGRRIVMSWRTADFPRDAADSRVEVHFETLGPSTRILILHTDIPEGQSEKYKALWNEKYIAPMRAYFSKFLPDPRNPPVRRPPPPPPEGSDDEPEEKPKSKLAMMKAARAAEAAARAASAARLPKAAPSGPGVHKAESKPAKAAPVPSTTPVPKAAPTPKAEPTPKAAKKPAPKGAARKPAKPAPKAVAKKATAKNAKNAKKPAPKAKKPAPKAKKPAPKAKKPAPKAKKKR